VAGLCIAALTPNIGCNLNGSPMKPFLAVLASVLSRLRGEPPPITEADVRGAQRDIDAASTAERAAAAEAARRAVQAASPDAGPRS
jgi:hypothetical protein